MSHGRGAAEIYEESVKPQQLSGELLPSELELIRTIGNGTMASVHLARDRKLRRLVAVKVLNSDLSRDVACKRRFEREAQAAARLSHASVTRVYSVGQLTDGRPFMVMEYIDGDTLADHIAGRGKVDIDEALRILAELADALADAHAHDIVHRDLKPANVLIERATGRVCLTDFGVAAILDTGSEAYTRLTRENERFGDPRYMSPEQLRSEDVDARSDVYSLGIIAYELLAGRGPFDVQEITDMATAHLRRQPADLRAANPAVPVAIAELVARCLAKRPQHRPHAAEVRDALRDPDDNTAGDAPARGAFARFFEELRQRKVYRAAAGYAAAVFVLLQVADLTLPPLGAPDIVYRALVLSSLAGFPVVVALAWLFDLRGGQLVRTTNEHPSRSGDRSLLLVRVLGLGVTVALAAGAAWWFLMHAP